MITILVSGASGIVGYGILKCLRTQGYRLIGTTIYSDSPAECFADIVEMVPATENDEYLSVLIELIEKYNVDMIIPGIEADMAFWNRHRKALEDTGTFVLLNTKELIELCLDKWLFYKELKKYDKDYCIESYIKADYGRFKIPFILKPRRGFGAKGVVKVDSKEVFEKYQEQIGKVLMMQEYIGTDSAEYTASAFFDVHSEMKALIMMRRKLSPNGYTEQAEIVDEADIKSIVLELAHIFHPVGPTNFQFRQDNGSWKLLEINPRISSSTSIKGSFGYNESKMAADYFLEGRKIEQPVIKRGRAIRYIEDYIFYDGNNI